MSLGPAELAVVGAVIAGGIAVLWRHRTPRLLTVWGLLCVVGLLSVAWRAERRQTARVENEALRAEVPHLERDGGYVSSDACRACHPDQYESWHDSWHRTMTQLASPDTVIAPFDGVKLESRGRTYRLEREGDTFWVEMVDPWWERAQVRKGVDVEALEKPRRRRARVVMTTGSHYQQTYWVAGPETREVFNFPFIWDLETQSWIPREDVFMRPPDAEPLRQTWNDNCLQCHATGPQPKFGKKSGKKTVSTRVGEMGIACEACHGPGREHIEANRDPARRYLAHLGASGSDSTIVNPAKLSPARASQVCGQCHSKSLINDAKQWYAGDGLTYRPGEALEHSRTPVLPRSNPDHPFIKQAASQDPEYLGKFFWSDGMVRVSGREYSGMVESACHTQGELSCLSCHELHGDDPNMQLGPNMRGPGACVGCHEAQGNDVAAHTHHGPDSPGSDCLNCHMSYTSFGLLRALRSHLIDSPTVQATVQTGRPNACNQCHLDRSLGWAADQLQAWYGTQKPDLDGDSGRLAAGAIWALEGDAGQRALAAWSMGWAPARAATGEDWTVPLLAELLRDPYAAVRFVAARSLRQLGRLDGIEYDFVGEPAGWDRARKAVLDGFQGARRTGSDVLIDPNGAPMAGEIGRMLNNRNDRPVELLE